MQLGAELDRQNKQFFTTEDIRQTQAVGSETRATEAARGEQQRAGTVAEGEQYRLGIQTAGEETRKTDLQRQMEDRYIAQRNHDWAQRAYRV
jgi:uncharacterized protein YbaP (TraB family)